MLGVQIYVTYTLTTVLPESVHARKNGRSTIGALIMAECISWTIASAIQFDVIDSCYILGAGTLVCILIACGCLVGRQFTVEHARTRPMVTLPYYPCRLLDGQRKLKL